MWEDLNTSWHGAGMYTQTALPYLSLNATVLVPILRIKREPPFCDFS